MRTLLRRAAVACGAVALIAGCSTSAPGGRSATAGGSGSTRSTATPGQVLNAGGTPVKGGTLKLSMSADPLCLDPHAISADTEQILGHLQFDNLTYLGKDGVPTPWLASAWKISPDGRTYRFTLRQGVTFADGTPFDAHAVVVNFAHMLDPATRSPLAGPYIAPYKDSTVIDDHTVEVHLKTAYSPFLYVLAQGWLGMESPRAITQDTPAQLCAHPVGSGPFELKSYTPNVGAKYVRRPGYDWGPPALGQSGPAELDGVDVSWIGQDPVRYNSLVSGQYQMTGYVPPQNGPALAANSEFVYENVNRIGWPFTFDFNTSRAPLSDVDVRKALVEGVDSKALVTTSQFGQRPPAGSYLDSVTEFYDPSAALPGYDPKAAAALLDKAGWGTRNASGVRTKDGRTLSLTLPVSNATTVSPVYELLQAQLKKLGVQLRIELEPQTQVTTQRYAGDYDLLSGVWHTNTPDVLYIKYASSQIPNSQHLGQNLARLSDPALDTVLEQARQTTDTTKLASLYAQAQKRLVTDVPGLPVYQNTVLWAFSKKLHDVVVDTSHGTPLLTYAWLSR
ncbi:ABC transporter substrate-binding protein [Actinacidiphila yanglinensis]|uniref:ABC transporter substrate-binding protein n=1 Tax=Actinacidiphila yanglinensis TaxID=310779 RepID=UPI0011B079CC|nr:ABC transporter substrate-binding protein [Actinacidiphila yanglinensis]